MSVLGRTRDAGVRSPRRVAAALVGAAAVVGLASTQVGFGELRAALAGVDTHVLAVRVSMGLADGERVGSLWRDR
jgi:hypothetical protein